MGSGMPLPVDGRAIWQRPMCMYTNGLCYTLCVRVRLFPLGYVSSMGVMGLCLNNLADFAVIVVLALPSHKSYNI